ncbi:MAG: hypothetical protein IPM74_13960 [Crocinitomicaceae bacterium]|nr:hypothetical protein [Crocinitomicaceae bacterium]
MRNRIWLILVFFLTALSGKSQYYDGQKGIGIYQPYDNSNITPDFRRKNAISIGVEHCWTTPLDGQLPMNFGVHLGYNYLVLKEKNRWLSAKKKTRDELHFGMGFHLSYFKNGEWFAQVKIKKPLLAIKGNLISFFFFYDIGFGLHKTTNVSELHPSPLSWSITSEVFNIRFGRSLFFINGLSYATRNDMSGKLPYDVSVIWALRYYIYKKK